LIVAKRAGGGSMLDETLLEILVCPKCGGDLEYRPDEEALLCHTCRLRYNIEDGIPVMLIDEAESF
jgi:uncharacterized protein YbaR (Trm112 family)